jgi:hypothetical protein
MYPIETCIEFDKSNSIWIEFLGQDKAYVHAILFITQAYFDFFNNQAISPGTAAHLVSTLQYLQESLSSSDRAIADCTISVVTSLAMGAQVIGDIASARQHVGGLQKIITMRGGMKGLGHNGQLQIKAAR